EVRALVPCTRAIVSIMSGAGDAEQLARHALRTSRKLGAIDCFVVAYRGFPSLLTYVSTDCADDTLCRIIERARDWSLAKKIGVKSTRRDMSGAVLTHRENEILDLIAQGMTNRAIAEKLVISESTVKVHVLHVLKKLGVNSR